MSDDRDVVLPRKPKISVVVVIYKMSRQAENTLRSFSPGHQIGVSPEDYELIVVENRSEDLLGEERARAANPHARYFLRENTSQSPVPAVIFGVEQCRADRIGLVIDGARMVTPRVIRYALDAFLITPHALVSVPGYHLGTAEQHRNPEHDERAEQRLLDHVDWEADGYRLFAISVFFRGRHQHGYLLPLMESNCVFFAREDYDAVGGADLRFDMPGGGMVNLDLYKRIGELSHVRLFLTPGEGTFHQFHGGVTTKFDEGREEMLTTFRDQYASIRGEKYQMLTKEPTLLGAVPGWAMPMLETSAAMATRALVPL